MPLSELRSLAESLYAERPRDRLFHYTSLSAFAQIVPSRTLFASEIHYLNDSTELTYATTCLQRQAQALVDSNAFDSELLRQLLEFLNDRLADGYWLCVVCFTEEGDLLSQWRGYTPHAQGVALGFAPDHLLSRASAQNFTFGRCIYDRHQQDELALAAVRSVAGSASAAGPADTGSAHPSQSYFPTFYQCEPALLKIAALMKHEAFSAEREWRAVSGVICDFKDDTLSYRSGKTTLVPYQPFRLADDNILDIGLDQVIHGPTPNTNLAVRALSHMLAKHQVNRGMRTVGPSRVPYRET